MRPWKSEGKASILALQVLASFCHSSPVPAVGQKREPKIGHCQAGVAMFQWNLQNSTEWEPDRSLELQYGNPWCTASAQNPLPSDQQEKKQLAPPSQSFQENALIKGPFRHHKRLYRRHSAFVVHCEFIKQPEDSSKVQLNNSNKQKKICYLKAKRFRLILFFISLRSYFN